MATTRPLARAGAGPTNGPHRERDEGDCDDRQDEPAGNHIGELLDGRPGAPRLADHLHDAREQRVRTHLLRAHRERAGLIDRAAGDLAAGAFSAGMGSPVNIASSTLDLPSTTTPSTGILAPGFTRRTSPVTTCSRPTSSSLPSAFTRMAVLGARLSRSLIALDVLDRARNSSTWPSSTNVTMADAASKYNGKPCMVRNACGRLSGKKRAYRLKKYAAATPSPIRLNMLSCHVRKERQPRSRNGQPAQSTTGVASSASTHCAQVAFIQCGSPVRSPTGRPPHRGRIRARVLPSPTRVTGWSTRAQPRSAGSCRATRDSHPPSLKERVAPASFRRWDNCPARPGESADAWGTYR